MLNDKHRGRVAAWRREQRRRAQRRAKKILKIEAGEGYQMFPRREIVDEGLYVGLNSLWKYNTSIHLEALCRADHFTECSCTYCGNPRRKWKGSYTATLTLQEKKNRDSYKNQKEEYDEDSDLW